MYFFLFLAVFMRTPVKFPYNAPNESQYARFPELLQRQ